MAVFHFEGRSWTSVDIKPGVLNCPPLTLFWGRGTLFGWWCWAVLWRWSVATERMDQWILLSWQMFFLFELAALVFFNVYPNNSQKTCIKMTHDKQLVERNTYIIRMISPKKTWSSFRFSWPWCLLNSIFVDGKHQNIPIFNHTNYTLGLLKSLVTMATISREVMENRDTSAKDTSFQQASLPARWGTG